MGENEQFRFSTTSSTQKEKEIFKYRNIATD